jgi:phosphatidylinositol glycan class B
MAYHFSSKFDKIFIGKYFQLSLNNLALFTVLLFYLLVAYNSVGFHQFDEHFQIAEFANYKLGWIDSTKLPWEFREKIRPGLQPFICFFVFKVCQLLGETDGYNLVLVLRVITAVFSVVVMTFLKNSYKSKIGSKLYPFLLFITFFLWFLPYLNVRFSSETWSGLFLVWSIAIIQTDKNRGELKRFFLIGVLLGISILCRYQSCLFVLGIGLWFIVINNVKTKGLVQFIFSLLVIFIVGVLIDRWLYGQYTITFYNYFHTNIVKNVASSFGTLPWYWIMLYVIKAPGPIGLLIFISFFVILFFQPKDILVWAIVPFVVIHSIIPHKELRFIFPIANLCPLIIIQGYQNIKGRIGLPVKYILVVLVVLLTFFNIAGLIAISFTGASGQVAVTNFIHRHYKNRHINLIVNNSVNPYIDGPPLCNTFYDGRAVTRHYITTFWKEDLFKYKQPGAANLLVIAEDDYTGSKNLKLFEKYHLIKVYQNIPDITETIYQYYDESLNNGSIWLYEFQ